MSQSNLFAEEYNLEAVRLIQPMGQTFRMYVPPRYEGHYAFSEYEKLTAKFLSRLLKSADTFIDVGAHSGFFSLLAARSNPIAKIIALEPTPSSCEILRRNFNLFGPAQVRIYQAAVSAGPGKETFVISAASDNCSFYEHPNAPPINHIEVETVSIDSLLRDQSAERIVIKIDTDGHELKVLSGMAETLNRVQDIRLVIEFNPKMQVIAGHKPDELLHELDRLGFALFLIDDIGGKFFKLLPDSDWRSIMNVESYANIYCVKKSEALSVVFFAHSAGLAGAERSLLELVDELIVDFGVVCTVVIPGDGPLVSAFDQVGAAIVVNNKFLQWSGSLTSESSERTSEQLIDGSRTLCSEFLSSIRNQNPDLIFTQTMTIPWGTATAALLGKHHIWSVCEFGELDHNLKFLDSLEDICSMIVKGSSLVLTNSDKVRTVLFPDLSEERVKTLYRHISIPPEYTAQPSKPIDANGRVRLAVIGTLAEGKGQEDAVRAVAELVARGRDVELLLVGYKNPAYFSKLDVLIQSLKLEDHVRIEDFSADPYSIILGSDILLVCSRNEAFGRVVVEGMLLGRPVVYSRSGGIPEYMKDGVTGLSYAPGDGHELARRIQEFIDDPMRTTQIIEEAKRYAEAKFSRDAYGGEVFRTMQKLRGTSNAAIELPSRIAVSMAAALESSENELRYVKADYDAQHVRQISLLTEVNDRVTALEMEVEDRDERINGQQSLLDSYASEFSLLHSRLAKALDDDARAELARILSSRTWRIAISLRAIILAFSGTTALSLTKRMYRKMPLSIQTRIKLRKILTNSSLFRGVVTPNEQPHAGKSLTVSTPVNNSDKSFLYDIFSKAQPVGMNLDYVPPLGESIDFSLSPLRLVAFYLPQFHPIPENDTWWGKGFTEWTNVSKAMPQYVGQYQPRLPGELGYYDLRIEDVQKQQIDLARRYGIYGFCYHHYWFGGKRLLQRPLQQVLKNKDLDLPFCLCWANENWTRRWDGQDQEVLIEQNHSAEDDVAFIADIADVLRDPRYIRIDGKPVLIVYRVSLLPDAKATAKRWRDYCRNAGIGELYLVAARSFDVTDPRRYGFDAAVEFPPHQAVVERINYKAEIVNPTFEGNIYDFRGLADWYKAQKSDQYPLIKTVSPGWDNEARRPGRGHSFYGASPAAYADWLRSACQTTLAELKKDVRTPDLVFINAWNEWAEGAYLEPDRQFGYAYLHATANILRDISPVPDETRRRVEHSQRDFRKTSDTAIIAHLHYVDLFEELLERIRCAPGADVFLSLSSSIRAEQLDRIVSELPLCRLAIYPNRGRDIYPFLETLKLIEGMGYDFACKVHAKKSLQRKDGQDLRREALQALLGSESTVRSIVQRLKEDPALGLVVPPGTLLDLGEADRNVLNRVWLDRLLPRLGLRNLVGNYRCQFCAGSMFWFRVAALEPVGKLDLQLSDFEEELGQVDGTLAHALERLMIAGGDTRGFKYEEA